MSATKVIKNSKAQIVCGKVIRGVAEICRIKVFLDCRFDVLFENPSYILFLVVLAAVRQCATLKISTRTGPVAGRH